MDESIDIVEPGTLCTVKTLYEGQSQCKCCINWVDFQPRNLKTSVEEQTEHKKHAILTRMKKNHDEGKPLVLDSIVVQNAFLKELLGQAFSQYNGVTTALKKLVFREPFREFFYEWDSLIQLCESQTDPEKQGLALLLQNVLAEELEEKLSQSKDLAENGVITYDYLWMIFRPGMEVYSPESGHDCIYKLVKAEYGEIESQPCFLLDVHSIDCNGSEFGWKSNNLRIPLFAGTKRVTDLEAFPISLHPNPPQLKQKAEARGRAARDYQTVVCYYAAYEGMARDETDSKFNVDGRIVVDAAAYELFNAKKALALKPLDSLPTEVTIDVSDNSQAHQPTVIPNLASPAVQSAATASREAQAKLIHSEKQTPRTLPSLEDKYLYLCSPEVRGYCLQTKKWATFKVDAIKPIRFNTSALHNLVISQDYKRLILAFVESQVANKNSFDDVIEGKGRGLIMLLEGSPGVGKTLTAEAIADRIQKPLYMLSGGELAQNARTLESKLNMILEVATKWDAIVLLDECDVFLEERTIDNVKRNATVAVFLRLLEYYRGILFMTTNRVDTIDPAFQSRIHLTINYPPLSHDARQQVWTQFIRTQCPDATITDREIRELSRAKMNGREIKNLVKTAQLLAKHEESVLSAGHFRIVSRVFRRRGASESDDGDGNGNAFTEDGAAAAGAKDHASDDERWSTVE